jgi:DUF2914 family protein
MKKTMLLGVALLVFATALTAPAQQTAPTATPAPAEAVKAPEPAQAPSLAISRMEIAANVMDRKPVDVGTSFPASTEKVYCYLEFKDVKKETAVNVVWTLGQKEMGKTQLTVKPYPKFRTWANKSLFGMTGDWKVDVVDEKGNVLKSAAFMVQ